MKHQRALALPVLLAISFLPTLMLTLGGTTHWTRLQTCVIFLTSLGNLLVIAAPYRAFPRFTVALTTLVASLALVEIVIIIKFHWYVDVDALAVLAETNVAEVSGLSDSVPWAILGCSMLPIGGLAWLAWPTRQRASHTWPGKMLAVVGTLTWGATVAAITFFAPSMHHSEDPFFQPARGAAAALRVGFPAGLPWVAGDFLRQRRALAQAVEMHRHFRFGVAKLPPAAHRRVYVLVIGESAREDRWGINGYKRNTTPRLAKRNALVSFKRIFTPWTFTRMAVPVMISRKPWNLHSAVFKEDSIVDAYKEAGFSTHWISLQPTIGFHDSPITVYAREADHLTLLNEYRRSFGDGLKRDDAAIPLLKQILDTPAEGDTFVVIHTWGSHFRYTSHYPRAAARFLPDNPVGRSSDLYNVADLPELSNAYDDTIVFTDEVLDGLIGQLAKHSKVESWLMYASDHGEGLFDDCKMESGHGPNKSYYTEHVAALFWPSPLYATEFPSKVATMEAHSTTLASTDMLFETISDLAGLQVPGNRQANSLAGTPLRIATESLDAEHTMLLRCGATAKYAAHHLLRQKSAENIHALATSGSPAQR